MSELAEYLQSVPSFELTKKISSEISERDFLENPKGAVIENLVLLTKQFNQALYDELRPDLEKHAYNYPFLSARIPFVNYESAKGRETYQSIQSLARRIPSVGRRYLPREIRNPVVPIVLPGVDYSAESLVNSFSLVGVTLPDKSRLGWQHLDAFADYCRGVMALGRETYASLMDAWYYGRDSDAYFQALETLAEEMLHHISDEIAGPRYSGRAVNWEHYWMKSYGEFPERLDVALLRLKDEYLGKLESLLSTNSSKDS